MSKLPQQNPEFQGEAAEQLLHDIQEELNDMVSSNISVDFQYRFKNFMYFFQKKRANLRRLKNDDRQNQAPHVRLEKLKKKEVKELLAEYNRFKAFFIQENSLAPY